MKSNPELIHKHGENLGLTMSVSLTFLSQIIELCQNDIVFEKLINKFPNLSFTLFKKTIQFFHYWINDIFFSFSFYIKNL